MFQSMQKLTDLLGGLTEADLTAELGADWLEIQGDARLVKDYVETVAVNRRRREGTVLTDWSDVFVCVGCGLIFLVPGGSKGASVCPWCLNRAEGLTDTEAAGIEQGG